MTLRYCLRLLAGGFINCITLMVNHACWHIDPPMWRDMVGLFIALFAVDWVAELVFTTAPLTSWLFQCVTSLVLAGVLYFSLAALWDIPANLSLLHNQAGWVILITGAYAALRVIRRP